MLRTKDASSLPLPFLAMVTIQCTAWTLYGYLQEDLSTFANNLVGVVLGGLQVSQPAAGGTTPLRRTRACYRCGLLAAIHAATSTLANTPSHNSN